nr:putative ribonuclease H-like domain-containing protein [Tanacetum cinerariifolium]
MIGSLMYLTSSRPDIMFAVCACVRFQVTPKVSYFHAVKRTFSDYAGASLNRKSTTRGCQVLGCRLISWQCKKQTVVATSSTEAEYVAAASCCAQGRMEEDVTIVKEINVAEPEPIFFDDEEVTMTMAQTLIKMKAGKSKLLDEQMAKRLHDEEVKQAATRERQEQDDFKRAQELQQQDTAPREFKKLRAEVEASGSHSTQDTPTDDPKEMFEEDVKNMLQIVLVAELKVEALQVKYPIIDWEIYSKGSRTYWKIIRVGGITQAYQSFKDMLKDFDREDLDALWGLTKEKFSTTMPLEDKEKALLIELKILYEPNAAESHKQEGMNTMPNLKLHIFMFSEKDYPLTDAVLLLMLSTKLQVNEDCEMARDLVMKIFMEANKPKSRKSLDTSS